LVFLWLVLSLRLCVTRLEPPDGGRRVSCVEANPRRRRIVIAYQIVRSLIAAALALLALLPVGVVAADLEGSRDHPMFTRLPGFHIEGYTASDFDSHDFSVTDKGDRAERTVEGRKTVITYMLDEGRKPASALQIVRNYDNAVKPIGGRTLYENTDPGNRIVTLVMNKAGNEVWLEVTAAGGDGYVLTVVEKAALVQEVTANDMLAALQRDGHVALYVQFDTGKATIRPESEKILVEVASMLAAQGQLRLAIEGHTDNAGSASANKPLSQQRAQAVVTALTARGIAGARLTAAGFGSEKPIADNATEAGRAKNRRVELVKR
jgi:OmpA-OmpF porin, OOP family